MKFDSSRRKVLALIGAAPAAPLAAKAIIDRELAALSGVTGPLAGSIGGPYSAAVPSACGQAAVGGIDVYEAAADFIDMFGVPEHIEQRMRMSSRRVEFFDPDIAAKKTWSNAVKVMTQRERNLTAMRDRIKDETTQNRKSKAFRSVSGFDWPWYY